MPDPVLPLPQADYAGPHQPGITDPVWPSNPPANTNPGIYGQLYAGQLERQRYLHLLTADVTVSTRSLLAELLAALSAYAARQMRKRPPALRPYDPPVVSRRVTVTIGFGATLFTTLAGDDRFGLAGLRPVSLKVMPNIEGDEDFDPRDDAADLVILIASDDYYVNEYIFGRFYYGVIPGLRVRSVERGYARPDSREPSGFEDGLTNPRAMPGAGSMHDFVYVRPEDEEPSWCTGGTYLAYRKIRRRMKAFFDLPSDAEREGVFGVVKDTGARLPQHPENAHAAKMNPRRPNHRDLFGIDDLERRILRRPYFFDDGLDGDRMELRGLHHLSFARNLLVQYEWPVLMWQTNPDFPTPGAGRDALYGVGGAANIGGGYYFMPAAPGEGEHLGTRLNL